MSDKTNPNAVWGPNEYAGNVAPSRPDASTVGPGGNTVDRKAIPKTLTESGTPNAAKPLGPVTGSSY